ncbi:hypothetical protein PJE062_2182 [Pseudovibrio sp. JE062]|nr:hypothetical protein PJE062_2182 [Pseudovibrio sp. JE062]
MWPMVSWGNVLYSEQPVLPFSRALKRIGHGPNHVDKGIN